MKKEKLRHKIYGLPDPANHRPFYIGHTEQPLRIRLNEHISEARRGLGSRAKVALIRDIIEAGQVDDLKIIELPWPVHLKGDPEVEWPEAEIFWIAYYRAAGFVLVNEADGGPGQHGTTHTEADIIKISKGMKAAHARRKQEQSNNNT